MTQTSLTLADLGWSAPFLSQLDLDDLDRFDPLRITSVHRDRASAIGPDGVRTLGFPPDISAGALAVGDWILAEPETDTIQRILERTTKLARLAAGGSGSQLIAANVDSLFIVSSCNADFNPARMERYLALAFEAGTLPVIVLTKADLTQDAEDYAHRARALSPKLGDVITLNAKDPDTFAPLRPWCGPGQTVAFAGSSGVGKSTLIAGLTGHAIATAAIRDDDAKGRHTTTARSLHLLSGGGLLIDLPGMRELGLIDVSDGIDQLFDDITELAATCRFSDCAHDGEPGCAVAAAIESGELDAARLARWRKMTQEDQRNSETPAEARRRQKGFSRMVKTAIRKKPGR